MSNERANYDKWTGEDGAPVEAWHAWQASRVAALEEAAPAICPNCRNGHDLNIASPTKDGKHVINDGEEFSWTVPCRAGYTFSG